jgi:uncharacterized protein (DUF2141 family)
MKFILLLVTMSLGIAHSGIAQTGTLVVTIEGIQAEKGGTVSAGIFKKADFPKDGKAFIVNEVKVTSNRMQVTFTGVPAGAYGVAIYQDIDSNKALKTNLVGLPREPIGFSNDARINFGPPSFEDARIVIEESKTLKIPVKLR